jgi:hypothetical protein
MAAANLMAAEWDTVFNDLHLRFRVSPSPSCSVLPISKLMDQLILLEVS